MGKKKRQADHSMRADEDSSDSIEENQTKTTVVNCPHANKAIHLPGVKKALKLDGSTLMCTGCSKSKNNSESLPENENEAFALLICLKCGHYGCGSGNKHAEQHSNNRKSEVHDLALNLTTWCIWCFKCDLEIPSNSSKKLLECYEFIKKFMSSSSIELKTSPVENDIEVKPSVSFLSSRSSKSLNSINNYPPGFETFTAPSYSFLDSLPRARGLHNLGNTCFFNAVLQCLGQTPFLLQVLEEMKEGGEKFRLPGGEIQVGEEKENLEPLEGTLKGWGHVTHILADTLSEIKSGKTEVFHPQKLLHQLHMKCPQFAGYGQHDSHELLRQLLEIVRTEDLQRYKQAILESLHLDKKSERDNITEEMRRKVKAYGKQANDLLLRPEQVFRGFLVSTLECQECHHKSDHVESFLDLSLPVMADKPVHVRLKSTYDEGGDLNSSAPSKHQLKKQRKAAAKSRKAHRHRGQPFSAAGDGASREQNGNNSSESDNDEQSDADVEDNVEPEVVKNQDVIESGYSSEKQINGDSTCGSPASETNIHINRDSAIASPITNGNTVVSNPADEILDLNIPENSLSKDNILISSPGSQLSMACQPSPLTSSSETNLECRLSPTDQDADSQMKSNRPTSRFDCSAEPIESSSVNNVTSVNEDGIFQSKDSEYAEVDVTQLKSSENDTMLRLENGFGKIALDTPEKVKSISSFFDKDDEDDDGDYFGTNGDGTIGQRSHGENSGECTIHSCLNQFTAKELMTGNNKVGCEACTKRVNHGKEGKTVLTNTSKQLLVGSPPAVLILHLKRFQVLRCAFKKKCREVKFPMILDLAPYCSTKCKGESTIKKNQNEILYSLYGVVEHMGTFHRGHYVAYIKVRSPMKPDDPRWSFLPKSATSCLSVQTKDIQTDNSVQNGAVGGSLSSPPGKWYYVSDSCTSEVKEENVLNSKAYLLFYERIW
ncbi:hypothetical protein RUM43_002140 [Polyplax serrata]|uniref:Ubiquitin carboxyl-terminal hydrolase n=1 Tax=Polyplax serrata TaxID=468196 RepID=A0AAN8RVQ2_POLSC